MGEKEAEKRRAEFISDIIGICESRRVLLQFDGNNDEYDELVFQEYPKDLCGYGFIVGVADLEAILREKVWEKLNPDL